MKYSLLYIILTFLFLTSTFSQPPKLYIHIVSHNEPTDNLNQPLNYAVAKNNVIQLANIVDSKNVKWNLQTSDGFVFGARQDEVSTGTNVFEILANAPFEDNLEIDPRSKNFSGRNIADQWYLLDSLGGNPSHTVGGFIYYVCPPGSPTQIDWWQYTDTITGLINGNKIKFNLLSGAGSLAPHCNDMNDFGIFKPDTTTNFYQHNPNRNLWCMGTGCAPVLDSMDNEQDIINLIRGQVDSIQNGLWPPDKFYVTRIMTNQREYGPMFFQKISTVIDSLKLIPDSMLKWTTIEETFSEFHNWQIATGNDFSQWLCGQSVTGLKEIAGTHDVLIYPNPATEKVALKFSDNFRHLIKVYDFTGKLIFENEMSDSETINFSDFPSGVYLIKVDNIYYRKVMKN